MCDEDGLPPKLLALIASGAAWAMALQEARGGGRRQWTDGSERLAPLWKRVAKGQPFGPAG